MARLTSGKCLASFITALQNNAGVTSLLGSGVNGIGTDTVTAKTSYPYILLLHVITLTDYAMGRVETKSQTRIRISIFAEDVAGKPAQESISEISEAVSAALSTPGAVAITGRNIETPVFNQISANKSDAFSESQVVSWENQSWDMFSTPA
jgi:hypothetical protein